MKRHFDYIIGRALLSLITQESGLKHNQTAQEWLAYRNRPLQQELEFFVRHDK
ncbi:hypothetical protein [Brevibacillus halotolerans]|uniref:hypothetical protein n=1 Tax=Brevibacillus halotolerans TaxID=1507437 RepID=UPI0015EE5E07|nr:hypothetical protein [Brevibacillus halotolerans]MBA4535221.1 hypothetical protein [Brevibacillus halotolerans]